MPSRAFAAFLALTVLWSAFAWIERQLPDAAPPALAQATAPHAGPGLAVGSVEDHHLDDRPGQPPADQAGDQPAAPPVGLRVPTFAVAAVDPLPAPRTPPASGIPERPLRPPRAA